MKQCRERQGIKQLHGELQPIQQSPHYPIDDSKRVLALMIMAQRKDSNKTRLERIPDVLYRIVFEYSDHNEIRTLFRMFSSSEDSKCALGLERNEVMHEKYASREAKVRYLKRLMNRPGSQCMELVHHQSNLFGCLGLGTKMHLSMRFDTHWIGKQWVNYPVWKFWNWGVWIYPSQCKIYRDYQCRSLIWI